MPKFLCNLPCTARQLELALHSKCDHGGLWNNRVCLVLKKPENVYYLEIETQESDDAEQSDTVAESQVLG